MDRYIHTYIHGVDRWMEGQTVAYIEMYTGGWMAGWIDGCP